MICPFAVGLDGINGLCAQLQPWNEQPELCLIALQNSILSEWIDLASDQFVDGIKPKMVMNAPAPAHHAYLQAVSADFLRLRLKG